MSDPAPDRAAALEQLARPPARRRALFRAGAWGTVPQRPLAPGADGEVGDPVADRPVVRRRREPPGLGEGPGWAVVAERVRSLPPSTGAVVGLVVLVAAAVVLWPVLRRPAPPDESLPRAGADPVTDVAPGSTAARPGATSSEPAAGASPSDQGGAAGPVTVHVAGAVAAPGVVTLPPGSRVVDAVGAAGGLRPDADSDRVNLAAPLGDGQRVVVPILGQPAPEVLGGGAPVGQAGGDGSAGGAGGSGEDPGPVDINRATAEELDELPGVGPATAAAILDHRTRSGPFRSVDDLIEVRGIGEAKLEALRDLVVVG